MKISNNKTDTDKSPIPFTHAIFNKFQVIAGMIVKR